MVSGLVSQETEEETKQTLAYDDQNPFHHDLDFYSPPSPPNIYTHYPLRAFRRCAVLQSAPTQLARSLLYR